MNGTVKRDLRWWRSDTPHKALFNHVKSIRTQTAPRRRTFVYSACLYDDADFFGSLPIKQGLEPESTLALNVVRPNVDTATTQLCKARPLPMPITRDGDYSQQRRARLMGKFLEGQWIRSKVWETNFQIVRDAFLYGTGFSYSYTVGDRVCYDRVFPWEVDVDPREGLYGKPKSLYLTRLVDRLYLQELYPKKAKAIENSDGFFDDFLSQSSMDTSDCVVVIEGWRLPSYEGAKDGHHVISVSDGTLLEEDYEGDAFPVIPFYIMPPSMGYYGVGMGKQLMGIQYTVNVIAQRCQEQAELAPCYLTVPNGGDIHIDELDNSAWPVIAHNPGYKPEILQAPPFNPAQFDFLKQLCNMSFDQTGVSQVAAQAELPAALKEASGIAIQLHNENRSERFNVASRLYETFCVDNAWLHFKLFGEIAKKHKNFSANTPTREKGRRVLQEVKWKEVAVDRDSFTLDVFPTTMLHAEPTMKAAQVESWINAGWISPDEGRMLLEFPDLDRVNNLSRAKHDIIDSIFERFLDPDKDPLDQETYVTPEPLFDLQLCMAKGIQAYLSAKLHGTEEDRLQLFRDFILDSQDELRLSQNATASTPGTDSAPVGSGPVPGPEAEQPVEQGPPQEGMTPTDLASMTQQK